jgi:hypothetical protein
MNRYSESHTASSLAMEQQSWARQIDDSLQRVTEGARAAGGADAHESLEGWQLIERALRMGADVLKSLPHRVS